MSPAPRSLTASVPAQWPRGGLLAVLASSQDAELEWRGRRGVSLEAPSEAASIEWGRRHVRERDRHDTHRPGDTGPACRQQSTTSKRAALLADQIGDLRLRCHKPVPADLRDIASSILLVPMLCSLKSKASPKESVCRSNDGRCRSPGPDGSWSRGRLMTRRSRIRRHWSWE